MADLDSLPLWLNVNASYQPQDARQELDVMFTEGVLSGGAVSQRGAGANMSVDVAAIKAIVQGDSIALQGKYLAWEDSVKNVTVGAAPGANSRIDSLVLRIYDATATGSGANKAALEVVAGTAAASPVAPTTPDSAILLATIGPILTSTTSITNAMITDARTYAALGGAYVGTANINSSAVTTAKIADDAVTTAKILNGNVTEAKLANSAVTPAKLGDDAVTTVKIANGNVTEAKLANSAVTPAKLGADAVTTAKIADGAVTQPKITTTWTQVGTFPLDVHYMKIGTTVYVYGVAPTTPVNLPSGYRPVQQRYIASYGAGGAGRVIIETNGNVSSLATNSANFSDFYEAA